LHVKETVQYQPSALVKATLRPYQIEGVQWFEHYNNGLGACLADDMGLENIANLIYSGRARKIRF
jgi:non-specific serine/threonine protein kinase